MFKSRIPQTDFPCDPGVETREEKRLVFSESGKCGIKRASILGHLSSFPSNTFLKIKK